MIKAILIDNESRSLHLLNNLLRDYCPQVMVLEMASSVDMAYGLILKLNPDVIFLDIEMQKETGFDLLLKFSEMPCEIIFTTAFEQYALKAIKFSALDYLLKPIDIEELKIAVSKIGERNLNIYSNRKFESLLQNIKSGPQQIAIPSADGLTILQIRDILFLKSDRQYTIFYTKSGDRVVASKNLGEFEELFQDHHFFRIHHSALVNLNEITKYQRGDGGSVVMSNGTTIEVAKRRKENFLKHFINK